MKWDCTLHFSVHPFHSHEIKGPGFTVAVILLIYVGPLEAVGSLMISADCSSIFINWTSPSTLNISGVDPDIAGYCITITSTTSPSTLNSQCGINKTDFHYTLPPDSACHIYNFTIAPVNIVGNGTSAEIIYSRAEEGNSIIMYLAGWCTYVTVLRVLTMHYPS